jgi:hypothetical protein
MSNYAVWIKVNEDDILNPNGDTIHDGVVLEGPQNPLSGYSSNGVNVWGDSKSMETMRQALHSHSQVDEWRTIIRHQREELGKLHAKFRALRGILWYPVSTEIDPDGYGVRRDEDSVRFAVETILSITGTK